MIEVITDSEVIAKLHLRFQKRLQKLFNEEVDCWVGYPGGNYEDTVLYSRQLNLWIAVQELDTRYWNGFGIGRPIEGGNNSLVGEINFPYEGVDRRIAGVFAKEDNGDILVLHRGKIGGGRKGIGKTYFTDNFRGDFITALDGDWETEFCLVGQLNSNLFPMQVANFIKEIYRVKNIGTYNSDTTLIELNNYNFLDEKYGVSVTEINNPKIIERTHGIIVNTLAELLTKKGLTVGNDKNRDLFIHKDGEITSLLEIKTNSATQSIYTAVGQLIIYSIPISNPVQLIAVLPDKLNKEVTKKINSLGIEILYYKWNNDEPIFKDLDKII